MGDKATEPPCIPCRKEEQQFSESENFQNAATVVLKKFIPHSFYHHYTKVSTLLKMIKRGRLFLSKCSKAGINDSQEYRKFYGDGNLMECAYIACFGHGSAESSAMWGLYGKSSPSAIRITIPKATMYKWMKNMEIRNGGATKKNEKARGELDLCRVNGECISSSAYLALFRDIIYLAIMKNDDPDRYDIQRANVARWENGMFRGRNDEDFIDDVYDGFYAGWVKDYEWCYERESRLCVKLRRPIGDEHISVKIPSYVFENMRFTFSPWIAQGKESAVERKILKALKEAGISIGNDKIKHFRRSTLHGALNFTGKSTGGEK